MYITSTGPLEKKKGVPGQGLAGSHMLTSADMSPTQEIDFHAEQLNLFLHILFIVSVHLGIS